MKRSLKSRLLAAHNRGVLGFLCGAMAEAPPKGRKGTIAAAVRAGWFSAKAAMGGGNG